MSTPTPRTDSDCFILPDMELVVSADFARKLERQLATEREKVRVLRDACESICDEWGRNHDANPIGAGQRMETMASKALEKLEDEA